MKGMAGLAALAAMAGIDDDGRKLLVESDIIGGFQPIKDLKPGDRVKIKSEKHNVYKSFNDLETVGTVHRVGNFSAHIVDGEPIEVQDFTILLSTSVAYHEVAFDSRRFVRVE